MTWRSAEPGGYIVGRFAAEPDSQRPQHIVFDFEPTFRRLVSLGFTEAWKDEWPWGHQVSPEARLGDGSAAVQQAGAAAPKAVGRPDPRAICSVRPERGWRGVASEEQGDAGEDIIASVRVFSTLCGGAGREGNIR